MHPLRALRERGNNTPEEVAALLADDVEFHSPILTRVVTGRDVISRIWALSSRVRSGHYLREDKLDEHTTCGGRARLTVGTSRSSNSLRTTRMA
jgi:hypothetical protein